jgi:hypothetical protein
MVPQNLRTLLWAWPEGLNGNRSCPPTEFLSARAMKLHAFVDRFGSWIRTIPVGRDTSRVEMEFWRAAADKSGTLWFHPPDVPIRVWAITIQPAGVIWAESAIGRISARRHVRLKPQRRRGLLDAIWQDRWGRAAGTFGGTCFRYAICAIAGAGVRNAIRVYR